MKQILQDARGGALELVEVPAPAPSAGQVLVRNRYSAVSPGTEKLAMDFARKSMLAKARSRPDLVKQVLKKLSHEGPLPTYRAVTTRLASPQPLGYSCAGIVEQVGEGVSQFAPGDRVACAGAGYANHAEFVVVPENLVVHVPGTLGLDKAAFATLGAIAMQGVRIADPSLGEIAAVIGLGLIGQLAVQLLRANGCRVLVIDLDEQRVQQALAQGGEWGATPADDHEAWRRTAAGGYGADLALVTAASESSAPIQLAADLCRAKGRLAVVGATAMNLDRRSFYGKELALRMSMSYGPGRYDRRYEELGLDYPISYVRWTENRNMQAFVALAAAGDVDPGKLDSREVAFEQAVDAYEELASGERKSLAVIFRYGEDAEAHREVVLTQKASAALNKEDLGVAFIGAGNYAKAQLLPAVARASGVRRASIVTATGASARRTAEKFGYAACATDPNVVLGDPAVDLVFIATQHGTHADLARAAIEVGKRVWLEKPVGLSKEEVAGLLEAAREKGAFLTVGYNRRFSPHARAVRDAFRRRSGPMIIRYNVAAGPTPAGSWITDSRTGGGRIVGECCHFVDLCLYLVGALPQTLYARALTRNSEQDDSALLVLGFGDGSTATIEYLACASAELPKERWEVSCEGRTALCDNYRSTRIHGGGRCKTVNQDKGQATAVSEVLAACRAGERSPFGLDELAATSAVTFAVSESVRTGAAVDLRPIIEDCGGGGHGS